MLLAQGQGGAHGAAGRPRFLDQASVRSQLAAQVLDGLGVAGGHLGGLAVRAAVGVASARACDARDQADQGDYGAAHRPGPQCA